MSDPKKFAKSYKLRKGAKHKDKMPGGVADKMKPSDFDKKQLAMGIKVEMEHTNDKSKALEIAMDHLAEDSKYYTKLKTIHKAGVIARPESKKDKKNKKKFLEEFKKSTYDFRDVKVSVDSAQHDRAEATACPELLEYLKRSIEADLHKIPMTQGTLTVYKKEQGLFSGFFADRDGQVVEKFDDMTIPILAKNLEVKNLYYAPVEAPVDETCQAEAKMTDVEDRIIDFLDHHNAIFHKDQKPGEPISGGKGSLSIKMGDIEIEIKKSVNAFVSEFKKTKSSKQIEVIKALQSWRRNSVHGKDSKSNLDAAQSLLQEWEKYSEEFYQIMHAMKQLDNE